eukprot:6177366-Pleurochrysis_carterae.AAC.5
MHTLTIKADSRAPRLAAAHSRTRYRHRQYRLPYISYSHWHFLAFGGFWNGLKRHAKNYGLKYCGGHTSTHLVVYWWYTSLLVLLVLPGWLETSPSPAEVFSFKHAACG